MDLGLSSMIRTQELHSAHECRSGLVGCSGCYNGWSVVVGRIPKMNEFFKVEHMSYVSTVAISKLAGENYYGIFNAFQCTIVTDLVQKNASKPSS